MLKTVILWPAIAQAALIFLTYIRLGMARSGAVRSGSVRDTDFAPGSEPPESARGRRAVANQFELPVVFFALIMLAMEVAATGYVMATLAWIFVASRVVHTLVHIGSNQLPLRGAVYGIGAIVLMAMWVGVLLAVL